MGQRTGVGSNSAGSSWRTPRRASSQKSSVVEYRISASPGAAKASRPVPASTDALAASFLGASSVAWLAISAPMPPGSSVSAAPVPPGSSAMRMASAGHSISYQSTSNGQVTPRASLCSQ